MRRYKIVLQQEQHFNLVLPYHEKYSIGIEGLVSLVYLDATPIGMILNCYPSLMHSEVFASSVPIRWEFANIDPSATVIQYVEVEEGMQLADSIPSIFNTILASASNLQELYLMDNSPDLQICLNFYTTDAKMALDVNAAIATNSNYAQSDLYMNIKSAFADLFSEVWAISSSVAMRFANRAALTLVLDIEGLPSTMDFKTRPANLAMCAAYYIDEWTEYYMVDLADMTMDDMMYGEVTE